MSDLSASHCGCGNSSRDNNFGCSGIIIILILFCLCGNRGDRDCDDRCGNGIFGGMNGGCGCESIIVILLLLCCCGGNGCFF